MYYVEGQPLFIIKWPGVFKQRFSLADLRSTIIEVSNVVGEDEISPRIKVRDVTVPINYRQHHLVRQFSEVSNIADVMRLGATVKTKIKKVTVEAGTKIALETADLSVEIVITPLRLVSTAEIYDDGWVSWRIGNVIGLVIKRGPDEIRDQIARRFT